MYDLSQDLLNVASLQKPDLEYLGQLLKDKKQLSAFPNVFSHVEKLLDEEINRVRIATFQCEFSHEPLQLPEAIGEISIHQEKLYVPIKQYPDYNFVGRILGPRGMTAKQLETETGCKIMCEDTENRAKIKMCRAIEEVNKLLIPQPEGEDELKRKQLMELAIINGTFRNGGIMPTTPTNNSNKNNNSLIPGVPLMIAAPSPSQLIKGLPPPPQPNTNNNTNNLLNNQLTNASIAQTLLQLGGISNNILNTPGPYGLALPQQNNGNSSSLDFFGTNQYQQQQDQQLSLLLQHQQMALLQQQQNNGGISFGEYTNNFGGTDSAGAILSGQRRFVGHSRDAAFPYGK
uniref:K Homology domain-containing protein n=1 Tax=Meloidogyne javanica TaxID=6303 RepID=A0A915MDJ5_MELJA